MKLEPGNDADLVNSDIDSLQRRQCNPQDDRDRRTTQNDCWQHGTTMLISSVLDSVQKHTAPQIKNSLLLLRAAASRTLAGTNNTARRPDPEKHKRALCVAMAVVGFIQKPNVTSFFRNPGEILIRVGLSG